MVSGRVTGRCAGPAGPARSVGSVVAQQAKRKAVRPCPTPPNCVARDFAPEPPGWRRNFCDQQSTASQLLPTRANATLAVFVDAEPRAPLPVAIRGRPLGDHPPASECAPTTRQPMHTAPADSGRGHKALSSRCATRNAGLLSKTARNSWTIPQLAQLPSILSGLSRTPGPQGTQPCQEPRVRSSSKAEHESQVFNPVVIPNRHCRETNRGQPKSGTQRRSSPTHHSRQKLGHRVPKGGRGIIPPARSIPPISPGCDRPTSLSQAIEPRAPSPEPYRAAGIRS
jgi:hypothetical protein